MKKLTLAATLGALTMMAAPAFAEHDGYRDGYRDSSRHRSERHAYAEVLSSRPIVRQVRVSRPRQECWDERVVYREPRHQQVVGPGLLIGAALGGVIGHQFGGGRGQDVATVAGAMIGASMGAQHEAYASSRHRGVRERVGYEQQCQTIQDVGYEQRIEAYDVTYRYHGRTYRTRLPYDPGRRLEVDVDVRPVRG
jgi:uncharacterized protein YcfJ